MKADGMAKSKRNANPMPGACSIFGIDVPVCQHDDRLDQHDLILLVIDIVERLARMISLATFQNACRRVGVQTFAFWYMERFIALRERNPAL